jgi:hypothetical protein
MRTVFNMSRVEEAAEHIANVLRPELDRGNIHNRVIAELKAKSTAWRDGLTNGERELAHQLALARLQAETVTKLAALMVEPGDYDEDDEAA